MARPHWQNCIANFDADVGTFVTTYFGETHRRCFVVAAAGFDPRSLTITEMLAARLGDRVSGLFIREERGTPDVAHVAAADANAAALQAAVPMSDIAVIEIFGPDGAPVGGARTGALIGGTPIPDGTSDVVLDMTALSIGIGFPIARLLLEYCERIGIAFHLMIASNPELDDAIASEQGDRPIAVRGFAGDGALDDDLEIARIWVPQLARGRSSALAAIGRSIAKIYKICPVVPFPARDPRRADALVTEYGGQLAGEWAVDPRDLVYVSESNPLDCYRTLSTLKARYDRTVEGVFHPSVILSPVGSRVMAAGALMAAIEHELPVHYIETVRYDFDPAQPEELETPDMVVHLLLSGPAYAMIELDPAIPASASGEAPEAA